MEHGQLAKWVDLEKIRLEMLEGRI